MTRVKDSDTGVFVSDMFNDWAGAPVHAKAKKFVDLSRKAAFLDPSDVRRLAHVFTQVQGKDIDDDENDLLADGPDMDEAINAYRSMTDAIAGHYIKGLPGKAQEWIAQAKTWLSDADMGIYVATTFLSGLKSTTGDLDEGAPPRTIDSGYTGPLAVIKNFHNEFSRSMTEYLTGLGVSGALYMEKWFDAIRETGDIIHDSDAIAKDVELTFFYLRYYHIGQTPDQTPEDVLGNKLALLSGEGFDRVDTALSSIRKLLLVRAVVPALIREDGDTHNRDVAVNVGNVLPLVIPERMRMDFVRVMHALINNGVKYHDMKNVKKKGKREVSVVSTMDQNLLRLCVIDNGRGAQNIRGHLAPEKRGGLAVAKRIADRNGWQLKVDSTPRIGTEAIVEIDTGAWSKTPDPAPGFRTTLPGPVPPYGGGGFVAKGWSPGLVGASMLAGIRPIN